MAATNINAWTDSSLDGETLTVRVWSADSGAEYAVADDGAFPLVDADGSPGLRRASITGGAVGIALVRVYLSGIEIASGFSESLDADGGEYWIGRDDRLLATVSVEVPSEIVVGWFAPAAVLQLSGVTINVTNPVLAGGRITRQIVRGRDYVGGNRIAVSVTGWKGNDLAAAVVALNANRVVNAAEQTWTCPADEVVIVDADAGDYLLHFAPSAALTEAAGSGEWRWGIDATTGAVVEPVVDPVQVLRFVDPAT